MTAFRIVKLDQSAVPARAQIQSLARGLEILKCFDTSATSLSLTEISEALRLRRGTVHRYVSTLQALGYLAQDSRRGRYKLTVKVLELGFSALNALGFPSIALPYLEQLAHQCQESASMAVLEGSDIVYVARAATKRWMSTNLQVGSRLPAYSTSMGKVLLAHTPWEEVEPLFRGRELVAHTAYTITSLERLKEALAEIRGIGYAINDQELEIGLRSAAAPVRDASGKVIAAVNISMAAARIPLNVLHEEFVPNLLHAAEKISSALGHRAEAKRQA